MASKDCAGRAFYTPSSWNEERPSWKLNVSRVYLFEKLGTSDKFTFIYYSAKNDSFFYCKFFTILSFAFAFPTQVFVRDQLRPKL